MMISSLILFFLGFIYSYYFYKDSQKNYEITVFVDTTKGKIDYCYVWNSVKHTIYKEDLLNESGCIEVYFQDGCHLEFAKISDKTSDYFNTSITQSNEKVKIEFDLLRPDEGFTLMSKSVIKSNLYWHIQIKQKKDILKFPRIIKSRGLKSNLYLFNNVFSYLSIALVVYTTFRIGKINFSNLNGFYEYFYAFFNLALLGFIVYITPILFNRIKASQPPKELKLHYLEKNLGKGN